VRSRASRLALPGVLTAAHQLVELTAGSGLIGQRHLGLGPAAALALLADGACVALAHDPRRRWDRFLAVAAGTAVAAPGLHYTLFPWRLRWGLPVLVEPEALRGPAATGYVVLLYTWAAAGAVALGAVPRERRRWALAGVAGAVGFRQLAADHLAWISQEADRRPRWWNRAWRTS
jgi:hypothetical protein